MTTDQFNREIRDLRISVTDRCNFRCGYCMPEEVFGEAYHFLPRKQILTFEEITRLVQNYVTLGVRKVRLTGGEPLLRQSLELLVAAIAQIDGIEDLALTTNGYLLPQKAKLLRRAGLHRLTLSLDTLDPRLFKQLAGKHLALDQVLRGIETAVMAGFSGIKLNTVIQRGVNEHEIGDLARFARERGLTIRFIEFMDVGTLNQWRIDKVVTAAEIVERVHAVFPVKPLAKHYRSEVANRFEYEDGKGEFGVISSVSQPFCGACSRVRLSAEGKIYTCLFGSEGRDIRQYLRDGTSDEVLRERLASVWENRTDRYSEERSEGVPAQRKIEMFKIGG